MGAIDKQLMLKYFVSPDDKLLFAKVIDQAYLCLRKHEKSFTQFLDPLRTEKMLDAFGTVSDIRIKAFGGFPEAERLMIGFSPEYEELNDSDFPITPLRLNFTSQFSSLKHSDFLGSVLGLGIDRGKIGDIVLKEDTAVLFCNSDIADYVLGGLTRVGRTPVSAEVCSDVSELFAKIPVEETRITVSSLRIDNIVCGAFNLPRSKAAELADKEKIFLNWVCAGSPSKTVSEGDIVTARGYGRIKIKEISGPTKKDRYVVWIIKY